MDSEELRLGAKREAWRTLLTLVIGTLVVGFLFIEGIGKALFDW